MAGEARFRKSARGSAHEVQTQLELASRLRFGKPSEIEMAQKMDIELCTILNAVMTTARVKAAAKAKKPA